MKRLTHWNGKKYVLTNGMGYGRTREFTDKLAAYENTGYEPEQLKAIIKAFKEMVEYMERHIYEHTD